MAKNSFAGNFTLLKSKCAEPCGGGAGGGGGIPIDYQPQIDKINQHLNQNDAKLTTHDVEIANIKNDYASKTLVNNIKDTLEQQLDTLGTSVTTNEQSIRNINNDLNNNYVTKLELSDETDKLNKRIDGITGGGSGVDYGPDIEALKNKDSQLDQRIVDNAGKIQANSTEINNIKTDYATTIALGDAVAKCLQDSNDYTDEQIKNLNLGGGGGSSTKLSDVFVIISVSIQDGNVVAQAFNPDDNSVLSSVNWDIRYKNCYFRSNSFTADSSVQIAQNNSYKYSQYDDAILFTNARIKLTWNNNEYIVGLKQTIMSYKDVDYVSESNLRLIAKRS